MYSSGALLPLLPVNKLSGFSDSRIISDEVLVSYKKYLRLSSSKVELCITFLSKLCGFPIDFL